MPQTRQPRPPNKEVLWEIIVKDNVTYMVTSGVTRDKYFLYKVGDNNVLSKRLATAKTPPKLKEFLEKGDG